VTIPIVRDPRYWRHRAEEARAMAELTADEESQRILLRIANDYETLARRAEERARRT
jgi:CRISPR/Cas system-associated protein Csm6